MSTQYYLQDCDPDNEDIEYDVSGETLRTLLMLFKSFCVAFSVDIPEKYHHGLLDRLSSYEINNTGSTDHVFESCIHVQKSFSRHFYLFNDETIHLLIELTEGLFHWNWCSALKMPENLTVYRKDHSVFFTSETHEGEAFLFVRPEENPQEILKLCPWTQLESDQYLSPISSL